MPRTGGASSGSFTQKNCTMLDPGGSYQASARPSRWYAGIYNLLDKQVIYDGVNYDIVLDGRRYWLGMNVSSDYRHHQPLPRFAAKGY